MCGFVACWTLLRRLPYVLPVLMQVSPVQCGFAGLQYVCVHVSVSE